MLAPHRKRTYLLAFKTA